MLLFQGLPMVKEVKGMGVELQKGVEECEEDRKGNITWWENERYKKR